MRILVMLVVAAIPAAAVQLTNSTRPDATDFQIGDSAWLITGLVLPQCDPIRDDPRCTALLRKMRLEK